MAALAETEPTTEAQDFVHTGPGTVAGRYLRMFWQPVYRSEDLAAGRATPLRIMSEDLTLYRGESGRAQALAFRCAHRGTQLSTGWVEGDDLRCFYHGWKYDGSGQCVEQPAEPEPFCSRIKIRSYPTEEYLGLIFIYMGEGDAPEFLRYPDFEREAGRETNIYFARRNFFNNLDNDGIHIYFVHRRPGTDFVNLKGRVPISEAEEDEFGVLHWTRRPGGGTPSPNHRGMPNIVVRKQKPNDQSPRSEDSLEWRVPVDDQNHLMVHVETAHFPEKVAPRPTNAENWWDPNDVADQILSGQLGREYIDIFRTDVMRVDDAIAHYANGRVTDIVKTQDAVAQGGQGQIADRSNEHLGRTDTSVILYRSLWQRELRALAEGRPLKQWFRPERYVTGL
jgi:5,5'-dehydrodivanillate O-demethylase